MKYRFIETQPGGSFWRYIEQHSPQTVRYMADPNDRGDYRFFLALDHRDDFAGLCIIAVAPLGFGPLANQRVACLENILVHARCRRRGIGAALLQKALKAAWQSCAAHLWWTVDYGNLAAVALYKSSGAVFIAEEDPSSETPEKYYTVVVANPGIAIRRGSNREKKQWTGPRRSAARKNRAKGTWPPRPRNDNLSP